MGQSQINLRLPEEQKERWQQYADAQNVNGGLSGLIRGAVDSYIERQTGARVTDTTDSGVESEVVLDRLASIEDTVTDVETTVGRVDESVGFIERKMVESDERPFSQRLLRSIPPSEPETEQWEEDRETFEGTREGEPIVWEGTVESFAESLDADVQMVEQSLEGLAKQQDSPIDVDEIEGEPRYWSERNLWQHRYADRREAAEYADERRFNERQEGRR